MKLRFSRGIGNPLPKTFVINEGKKDLPIVANQLKKLKDIEFYRTEDNDCPVAQFIFNDIDDVKLVAKIASDMVTLQELKDKAREPLVKHIEDGIFELRSVQGSDRTRIFYFFVFGNKIIMTNGYKKKQKKMSKSAFDLAKKYRNDYLRRVSK